MSKIKKAIAEVADCKQSDLVEEGYDHYGLRLFSVGHSNSAMQYAAGLDSEADAAAEEYIKGSIWAFNASFLAEYTELPEEIFSALQEKRYEDANDPILKLVERTDGGLEGLVEDAVEADGRGHFLAGYDSEEHEVQVSHRGLETTYYVYRVN